MQNDDFPDSSYDYPVEFPHVGYHDKRLYFSDRVC